MPPHAPNYEDVADRLDTFWEEQDGPRFRAALLDLTSLADGGDLEAAEALAEILSQQGSHYAPDAAYKWYFIVLSQQGYSADFQDLNGAPPAYRGADGDFRNEARVSELVSALGFVRVADLDREAAEWLRAHGLSIPVPAAGV